jgi:hypothetical protein
MTEFLFNQKQFSVLLSHLSQPDWLTFWLNVLAQFVAVGVAAYSGYFFQVRFSQRQEVEQKKQETHRFNEAVVYLSSLLESYSNHMDSLVLPNRDLETKVLQEANAIAAGTKSSGVFRLTLSSIRPLEVFNPSDFIAKIPNIGQHAEFLQAFHRTRDYTLQFNAISEERNLLVKEFIGSQPTPSHLPLRIGEILDRTTKLVVVGEGVLDGCTFLASELIKFRDNIKDELKIRKIIGLKIMGLERNPFHEDLRLRLRDLIDQHPEFANRMLHVPRDS